MTQFNNNKYTNLVEASNDLYKRGFIKSYKIDDNGKFYTIDNPRALHPEEFTIVEYHRFEGTTAPEDMSVIYALESSSGERGTIIDAYGAYASGILAEAIQQMKVAEQENQQL